MGGSRKWCPHCEALRGVKIIPAGRYDNFSSKQRNFWKDDGTGVEGNRLHYFQRKAYCLTCGNEWDTMELEYNDVDRLCTVQKMLIAEKEMHINEINVLTVKNRKQQLNITALENTIKILEDGCKTRDEAIVILEKRIADRDRRLDLLETLNKTQAKGLGKRNEEIESLKTALIDVSVEHEKQLGKLRELQNAINVVMKHAQFEVEVDA